MSDKLNQGAGADDKHEAARNMADDAMRADAAGDAERATALLDQAQRVDPDAVVEAVEEVGAGPATTDDDAELSTMSEMVVPGSASPSRAGITGPGSGADGQGL